MRQLFSAMMLVNLTLLAVLVVGTGSTEADDQPKTVLKTEHFDRDPGWEGHNNRVVLKDAPTVTQNFGYSSTNFASKEKGEIGGPITRSSRPAYYGEKLAGKTLNDKLTASGTFALTASTGNSGVFFGWFNAEQPGGGGRPMNSLGMNFDGEKSGGRLAVRMINGNNKSCGTFVTPFIPGKFRPTPIKNDGTRYTWTLTYDPDAKQGNGQFRFMTKSNSAKPEDFEGKPFTVDLPAGFKKEGAVFDRFGLMNMMKAGNRMTIYFGDLQHNGKPEPLTSDPGWVGSGNRDSYQDREQGGAHDYGFSASTSFAGGKPGEIGGVFWRSGKYSYYADRVGPLTLDDRLEARGKVVLRSGAPDSDMFLGWFNSANKEQPPTQAGHFLGVHVGGPTRVGHYFHPSLTTAKGTRGQAATGPLLKQGQAYDWSLVYDPAAEAGRGAIQVTLGKESVTLPLKKGLRAQGASFDRFGVFTPAIGGQIVRLYLDDLTYTTARSTR
jgi:hypothetical protein